MNETEPSDYQKDLNIQAAEAQMDEKFIIVALKTSTIVFSGHLKGAKERAKIIRACDGECEIFKLTKY